ncbi:MAG: TolC family protein [Candidatus Latescibacteria bacterium]|jgi:outer membrane protein|nr:TolC family protein [Candidatus Latescibacterota bacterium]
MKRNTFITAALCIIIELCISGLHPARAQMVITYEKALNIAMENSPDIKRTSLNLERSSEMLNAQKASLKSQFSLTLNPFSFDKNRTFNRLFSAWNTNETKESLGTFTISQPIKKTDATLSLINRLSWQDSYSDFQGIRDKSFNNNLYISFQQPIFTYNRTQLELRELELDLENTSLTFAIQKLSLERQVANGFYNVYRQKMSLDIAVDELENQKQSYEIIKNKVDAGLNALEELYQAELNLATSESNLQNQRVSLDNELDNFKLLIGIALTETILIDADVTHKPVEVDLDKALNTGLKNRMELRQRKINLENAQFDVIRTAAQNEFKGNMTLSYGIIGTEENFAEMYAEPTQRQSVGISFDIPLWDWGENKSRIKASEATVKSRKLSFEDERNAIIIGIRQSHRSLNNLVNQIEIARQNVRNAELTYDINLERYKNGDLTSYDLNNFQTQLSQKKTGHIQALINYKLALLDLKIQSLWDFELNQSALPEELMYTQ